MTDFVPTEKGVPIRFPSTAYLNIDSTDRFNVTGVGNPGEKSSNFTINRNLNVLNGFFTRLAVQEVYLDYCLDNISSGWGNNTLVIDISGLPPLPFTATLTAGHYNTQEALDAIVASLNGQTLPTHQFLLSTNPDGTKSLDISGGAGEFLIKTGNLQTQMNLSAEEYGAGFPISCPKLLPQTYLDFASPVLGQNQEVYDSTTNYVERNLLYRWWLAYDNVACPVDSYNYPILQGYKPFIARRLISFPKQIKWSANQPIGTLSFQVYGSDGALLPETAGEIGEFEWGMTILASEV